MLLCLLRYLASPLLVCDESKYVKGICSESGLAGR